MKRQNLKSTLKTLLAGLCITSGGLTFAGSVTISGTTGTNPTYIVIPEEYAGKEGQFVATATSSNNTITTCGVPYKNGDLIYITKTQRQYATIFYNLYSPSGKGYSGSSVKLPSLEKGSYRVELEQRVNIYETYYSLHRNYWADTDAQTFSDLTYYAQNGSLPANVGITHAPVRDGGNNTYSDTQEGVNIASAYIVVYGVDDGGSGSEPVDPAPGGDSGGSSGNIDINITTGTDDGVYTLLDSLFSYISEMQSILSASDDAIRS